MGDKHKFDSSGKIIELYPPIQVGESAKFYFDCIQNKSYWNPRLHQILGKIEGQKSFEKIIQLVDVRDRDKFTEMSVGQGHNGKEEFVETAPIQMKNGNIITEKYKFLRSDEQGLYGIEGETKLIAVA